MINEDIMADEMPKVEQKESIKLFKNTKGYNWEIRILEANIDRIEQLNNEMHKRFGGGYVDD